MSLLETVKKYAKGVTGGRGWWPSKNTGDEDHTGFGVGDDPEIIEERRGWLEDVEAVLEEEAEKRMREAEKAKKRGRSPSPIRRREVESLILEKVGPSPAEWKHASELDKKTRLINFIKRINQEEDFTPENFERFITENRFNLSSLKGFIRDVIEEFYSRIIDRRIPEPGEYQGPDPFGPFGHTFAGRESSDYLYELCMYVYSILYYKIGAIIHMDNISGYLKTFLELRKGLDDLEGTRKKFIENFINQSTRILFSSLVRNVAGIEISPETPGLTLFNPPKSR